MRLQSLTLLFVVLALFGWGSCKGGRQPVLAFTQSWPNLPLAVAYNLATGLNNGTASFSDVNLQSSLRVDECAIFADFTRSPAPKFSGSGAPGTPGFNVNIASSNFAKSGNPCPSGAAPTQLTIQPATGISIGQTTHTGTATFTIGNDTFTSATGYFEFTLTGYDTSTGFATGTFQFLVFNTGNPADTRVYAIRGGSFGMPIHFH